MATQHYSIVQLLVVTILMVLGSIPNGAGTMVLLFLVHFHNIIVKCVTTP